MTMLRMLPVTAILGLLAGCGSGLPAGTYAVSADTAYERLRAGDMDDFRNARQCGILIHFSIGGTPGREVRWTVTSSGRRVAGFAARLIPEGAERTRVEIDIPEAPDGGEIYDGTKSYPRPALIQPLRPAVEELVAARIGQRKFDVGHIPRGGGNSVCQVQRAGLESGSFRFSVDDEPGMDSRATQRLRDAEQRHADYDTFDRTYGQPMDDARGDSARGDWAGGNW